MQKDGTLAFWNDYHVQEKAKEWILVPSDAVLAKIEEYMPESPRVLEIGCGSSRMALDLFRRTGGSYLVTDVSEICINNNRQRDAKEIFNGDFEYAVLNMLEKNSLLNRQFDVVLDKGCMDTLLFRSPQREHGKLLTALLDNMHSKLDKECGKFLIITPRAKLKFVRDYAGFSQTERVAFHESSGCIGDLEGSSKNKRTVYLHVCHVDKNYEVGADEAFRATYDILLQGDDATCPQCSTTFFEFRSGEGLDGKGESFWARRWKGHKVHCQGK